MIDSFHPVTASPLTRRVISWLLLGLTPILVLAIWLVSSIVLSEEQKLRRVSQMAAQHNLEMLDRIILERYGDIQILADLPTLRKDSAQISTRLDNFMTTYAPYYALILVLDRQGRIEAVNRIDAKGQPIPSSALIGRSMGREPWFERALQAGRSVSVEDIHQDPLMGQVYGEPRLTLSLSAPIRDEQGNVVRVVSSRIPLSALAESLVLAGHEYRALEQSPVSLVLVTREGMELAKTPMPGTPIRTPQELNKHVSSQPPLATITSAGFSTYSGLGWRIIAYPPESSHQNTQLIWGSTTLAVLLVVVTGMIALWLYRSVLVPITAIRQGMDQIARREPVDLGPIRVCDDELGDLAQTVEQTAQATIQHQQRLERVQTICQELQRVQTLDLSASSQEAFLFQLLHHAVDLTGARYGAIGIFDEAGEQLAQFLTVGLDEAARAAIGAPPTGKGLLGFLAQQDQPVRLKDLMAHPAAAGYPPHHPPMHSFLGHSIKVGPRLYGRIYLTEKVGAEEFSEADATVVSILAAQAGIAIESGQYIAALRTAEASLRASQRQLQAILDHTSAVVFLKDLHGRYLLVNRRYENLFHVTQETITGKTDYDLFPAAMAAAFQEADAKALAANAPISVEELIPQDDGLHTYIAVKFPLYDDAGQSYGVCGIATDITERKHLEAQLHQAQKLEAIGRLAGGIAHDFNNLLTVISGNTRLMREELPAAHPGHELVAEIAEAGDRASQLTAQLLAFSRKQRTQPTLLDLSQTLVTMERLLRRLIGEDVAIRLVPGPPGRLILADPTQLEQVILNLALNARDAMPQGGRLTIDAGPVDLHEAERCSHGTLAPGAYVRLRVTDTGVGMPADTLAHCFEPFFTTKGQGKGTGLGLAMVYGIVQSCQGIIDVTSQPSQGTCFTLYVPRAEGATGSAKETPAPSARRGGAETVLLVEDERAVRTWLRKVLTRAGYRVLDAPDGPQALALCRNQADPIDLLLTDLVMPGLSGPEVAAQLTQERPALRVLYMSGYSDHPVFRDTGAAQALLQKPFTPEQVLETIRAVLDAPPH